MNKEQDTLLTFPCEFPIKIMGKSSLNFQAIVLNIIRKHAPSISEAAISTRYSKDFKYISITATINATSKQQLDALYSELSAHEEIMVVL